jgi:hypothetical protein
VEQEPGDAADLQFTAVTAEGAAETRYSALFDQAQAHAQGMMAWWEANREAYMQDYHRLSVDEQRLVLVLERIRGQQ